jgi:hypothetical protein
MIIMPYRFSPAIAAAHRLGRLLARHRHWAHEARAITSRQDSGS